MRMKKWGKLTVPDLMRTGVTGFSNRNIYAIS